MYLDTDGDGFNRAMIETMVGIFVEELTPLNLDAEIDVAPAEWAKVGSSWRSSDQPRRPS